MGKTLIVYYSLEGHTREIAEIMAKEITAETLELKPLKDISPGALKYMTGGSQVVKKSTPKLQAYDVDFNDYDLIIIGTPVWAWTYTPAIRTFLTKERIAGKKIALFCTNRGGEGSTLEAMKKELTGNQIVSEISFRTKKEDKEINQKKVLDWLQEIKINK